MGSALFACSIKVTLRAPSSVTATASTSSLALLSITNTFPSYGRVGSSTAAFSFTVTNTGGATATITSRALVTGTQFSISGGTCTAAATVAPSATCTLLVVFTPTTVGLKTDTLNLVYDDGAAPQTAILALSSTGLDPGLLTISNTAIANTTIGSPSTTTFTVTNGGTVAATLSLATLTHGYANPSYSNFTMTGGTCSNGMSLAAAGTCTVTIRFAPDVIPGTYQDEINLDYDDGAGAQTGSRVITGISIDPALITLVAGAAFVDTAVNSTSPLVTYTATNVSGAAVTIQTPSFLTGTEFAVVGGGTCSNGLVLAAAASCTYILRFSPLVSAGGRADLFYVAYTNGTLTSQCSAALSATALAAAAPAVLTISAPTSPTAIAGNAAASQTLTVHNSGGQTATITSRSLNSAVNYTLTGGTCAAAATVTAGSDCTLIVTFTPAVATSGTSANYAIVSLVYHDGAAGGQTATRTLGGTAIPPLSFSIAGFTEHPAGTTTTSMNITVSNPAGNYTAQALNFSVVTGTYFSITGGTCVGGGGTLAANASCTISVQFSANSPLAIAGDYSYNGSFTDQIQTTYTLNGYSGAKTSNLSAVAAPFESGLGTSGDPYLVTSRLQFWSIRDYRGATYTQANDIDLLGFDFLNDPDPAYVFIPFEFSGVYDGDHRILSGIYSTSASGLFTQFTGMIKKLSIPTFQVDATGEDAVGLIAATAKGAFTIDDLQIGESGRTPTLVRSSDNPAAGFTGGLVGYIDGDGGFINAVSIKAEVSNDSDFGLAFIGGLIGGTSATTSAATIVDTVSVEGIVDSRGWNDGAGGVVGEVLGGLFITRSSSSGMVTLADAGISAGGFVGSADGVIELVLSVNHFSGVMTGTTTTSVGGIIGSIGITQDVSIAGCDSTGAITGGDYTGGIVGQSRGGLSIQETYSTGRIIGLSDVGGIVGGSNAADALFKVYSRADVTGDTRVGGLAGTFQNGSILDSYFSGSVVGTGGIELGGLVGDDTGSDIGRSYAAASVANSVPALGGSISSAVGANSYSNVYQVVFGVPTSTAHVAVTGISDVDEVNIANEGSYTGFNFTALTGTWVIPNAHPGHPDKRPILRWQCDQDGFTCN